jgi:hypothetical protein
MPNALDAYAIRQRRIWSRRIDVFLEAWVPALNTADVGQDWLVRYRDRYACAMASKARKSQPSAVPLVKTSPAVDEHPAPTHPEVGDTAEDVLLWAENGVWDEQRVDSWVPSGEAVDDDDDDDDDSEDGASSGADEDL